MHTPHAYDNPADAASLASRLSFVPPCPRAERRARRRGTAEIELLLSVIVFLSMIFLAIGAGKIAVSRMSTRQTAAFRAFHDATDQDTPVYTGNPDPAPIDGLNTIRPSLPNRLHVPTITDTVTYYAGNGEWMPPVKVGSRAALVGPAWTLSTYPVPADIQPTNDWFTNFADESHGELTAPLSLAPAWRP